jgi:class 3 adenylate cyclase
LISNSVFLLNILPKAIAARLKEGEIIIADGFPEVTVLFSDFVGFTKFSSDVSPKELIGRLNQVFSVFDVLCERYGLEKIKTIGDAYMVAGGIPTPRADHAEAVADLALAMQREGTRLSVQSGQPFQMRIGINSGPVIAGVIGTKKFAYDLWGDTVNVASRMESHAPPGGIRVTVEQSGSFSSTLSAQFQTRSSFVPFANSIRGRPKKFLRRCLTISEFVSFFVAFPRQTVPKCIVASRLKKIQQDADWRRAALAGRASYPKNVVEIPIHLMT